MLDNNPSIPHAGQKQLTGMIPDGLDAAWLARVARQNNGPLLVLTADAQAAQRLQVEMPFFDPTLKVALFPDWETLPYDHFSPHSDLISERLATLWKIRQGECDVVLAPLSTAMTRLPPVAFLLGRTFFLKTGQRLDLEQLRADMVTAGYTHVTQVMVPGEFSIRGGLIDLFPMGSVLPYRIDLFDNDIDTLRTFDPDTQRTLYPVQEIRMSITRSTAATRAIISNGNPTVASTKLITTRPVPGTPAAPIAPTVVVSTTMTFCSSDSSTPAALAAKIATAPK